MYNTQNKFKGYNDNSVHQGISVFKRITTVIAVTGGILYSVTGLFTVHVLNSLIGIEHPIIENTLYVIVGISAGYTLVRKIIKWLTNKDEHSLYNSVASDSSESFNKKF